MPGSAPADKAEFVSVIILTRNRREDLILCLESLARQSHPRFETLVFDNGSADGTRETVAQRFAWARYLRSETNLGTSLSRNLAVSLTRGKYLWFLDDDTVVHESGYMAEMARLFEAEPGLGAVGGEAVLDGGNSIVGVKSLELHANGLIRGVFRCDLGQGERRDVRCLPTCNFFTTREAFAKAGGFDPWFFFYLEDLDLSYRLYKRGYRLQIYGRTPVEHRFSTHARHRVVFLPKRNRNFFILKNGAWWQILLLPFLDIAFLLHPDNFRRMRRFAAAGGTGAQGFVRLPDSGSGTSAGTPALWSAIVRALELLLSMAAGYLLVLPHVPAALRRRANPMNHLENSDFLELRQRYEAGAATATADQPGDGDPVPTTIFKNSRA